MTLPLIRMTLGYLVERGHLTMIHRIMKPSDIHYMMWIAPGGTFEGLELPDECLKREFQEETGLTPEEFSRFGVINFDNEERTKPNGEPCSFNAEVFLYGINRARGDLKNTDDRGNPIYRVPINHVYNKPMHEGDKWLWETIQQNWGRPFDAYIRNIGYKLDKRKSHIDLH